MIIVTKKEEEKKWDLYHGLFILMVGETIILAQGVWDLKEAPHKWCCWSSHYGKALSDWTRKEIIRYVVYIYNLKCLIFVSNKSSFTMNEGHLELS